MIGGVDSVNNKKPPSKSSIIYFITRVNSLRMNIILDTGAKYSLINAEFLKKHKNNFIFLTKQSRQFTLADGIGFLTATGTTKLKI